MEWKEQLISTDVDRLLEYLADKEEASVAQASKDLDVSQERINTWARALIDAGLVKRSYSTTKGKVLHIADREKAEEKIKEVKDETQEEVDEAKNETDPRKEELQEAWETVEDLLDALEERKELTQRIEEDLMELQAEEDDLNEELKESDDEIEEELLETLGTIEEHMNDIDTIEEDIEQFQERRSKIESNLEALKKLEEHRKELRKRELEGYKCEECGRIFDTERGLHVHQSQVHDDDEAGLLERLKPW